MMNLFIKAIAGAMVVVLIAIFSKSKNYYIAGLVPLFPTFTLIAHYIVGTEHSNEELKTTVLFGMWSTIPYFIYVISFYFLIGRLRLGLALLSSVGLWALASFVLVIVWKSYNM